MSFALFLLSQAALVPFGAAAAFHPSVRGLGTAARIAIAYGAGAVVLTVEAVVLSALGVPWSVAILALPALAGNAVLAGRWSRRADDGPTPQALRVSRPIAATAILASACALWHLVASLFTSRATSVDYVLFWGAKAARFHAARGIDATLLASRYFLHAVPDYPPLVPVVGAWSALVAGRLHWKANLLGTALWLVAAVPVVLALLRRRMSDDEAASVAAFWTSALAISLAWSYSGGSAEAPLLFFESVAAAALLAEDDEAPATSRFLPAVALAGAALTKVEGTLGAVALIGGAFWRDAAADPRRAFRRALPLAGGLASALVLWFGFQLVSRLPVGYRSHGPLLDLHWRNLGGILRDMVVDLRAGTLGLSWIVPAALFVLAGRRLRPVTPALALTGAVLLFLVFDYLHDPQEPWERIGWTLPRVSQPALSAWILAAGFAAARAASSSTTGIGAKVRAADQRIQGSGSGTGAR